MTEEAATRDAAAPTHRRGASQPARAAAAGRTTPRPASRSSRASRRSGAARACTSARPTPAACTTSSGRSSTTRSTRRWPATPRRSRSRSRPTARSSSQDDGRGVPGRQALRPARTPSRSSTPSSTPAASSAAAATRCPAASTASASASSTRCRSGCGSRSARDGNVWARSTSAASPRRPSRRSGRRAAGAAPRTAFRPTPRCSRRSTSRSRPIAQRLRESAYLTKGVWIRFVDERADRERSFYFEGGLAVVRAAPQPEQGGPPPPPDLRRAQEGDRPPIEVALQYNDTLHRERPRLRQQHQHGRRRHPRHRLPRGADQLAQRLGAARRRSSRTTTPTCRATTSARA